MGLLGVHARFVIFPVLGLCGCGGIVPTGRADPDTVWKSNRFAERRKAGEQALRAGEYPKAIEEFRHGAEAAQQAGDWISAGRFLSNESAAHMMRGENRQAIQSLSRAREAATRTSDLLTLQSVEANLATVYVLTGDYEAAAAAAGRGAAIRSPRQAAEQRIRALMSFGRAMAKSGSLDAAAALFDEAFGLAANQSQEADILELWGYELGEADSRRAKEAEDLLTQAWYKRTLVHDKRLPLTEGKLARMCRRNGDTVAARRWMDRTLTAMAGGQKLPVQEWVLRAEEAHISSDEGRLREALAGYRTVLALVEKWRNGLPAQERLRLRAEQRMVQEVFEGYLEAAGRLYRQEPGAALAAEMFRLIQETRAWSLDGGQTSMARDEKMYAEARRLEGRWLAGDRKARAALRVLRASILERDAARAAAANAGGVKHLAPPKPGEAILTFWLHPEGSWLWVWNDTGLTQVALGGRERILHAIDAFRRAVAENRPDARAAGLELRHLLLGSQEAACLRAKRWDIVADEGLFHVPFGALPGSGASYLIEQMEIRLIPNALRSPEYVPDHLRFLAVADPIFNAADRRRKQSWTWPRTVLASNPALPRLPGTRREAEAARTAWAGAGYETAIQTGEDSSEESVLGRLSEWQPRVIHFATHTITASGGGAGIEDRRPRLALSLRPDGSSGLLTAEDIAAIPLRAELVVMSACQSAGGEPVKGSGMLGLTRAWLTAGARKVISTLWPVGDESTLFFSTFYRELSGGAPGRPLGVAAALRQAQIACIRSGGVTAQPRNWAGHVLLARR